MAVIELGDSIPSLTPHAVSMSLPTWADNVGYEEGDKRVMDKLPNGYPRFLIHSNIAGLANDIIAKYGTPDQSAMLFPSHKAAHRCRNFMQATAELGCAGEINIIDLFLGKGKEVSAITAKLSPSISAVIFRKDLFPIAKQYWQHSGDGISSRYAEFCHSLFLDGKLADSASLQPTINQKRGPRRYQSVSRYTTSQAENKAVSEERVESAQFLEERFGRNLDISLVDNAKLALRRRIAGSLVGEVDLSVEPSPNITSDSRGVTGLSDNDVYLYPCGMNAIFNTHRMLLESRGQLKSISFGFPYIDTLKVLQKFGPGCLFYGNGSSGDLDDLEARLKAGERYLALFCEFPGNPMLKCPDLKRIKQLADTYDFGVVVDETIANSINVHVLPYADVVVSSLTKIFSGDCNVMGGSAILNPEGRYYQQLKSAFASDYEDNYWAEDVMFMERNSRDFATRIKKINDNAETICTLLQAHPLVKDVYYPKYSRTKKFYDECRTPTGGYGGLLSFTFHKKAHAVAFFDRIETAKGPSLGTNFTLTSPYVLLAHYGELDWAAGFGVPADLLRISVGVEDAEDLKSRFAIALQAAEAVGSGQD
ncbi:pyridoxal phosphate-dependent transferase [Aspergillus pseudonomiae]|uniref:cystathionine gamma-synthase n=1 Tax=Aspergillus pseudonomiae TaxID=1506151 RepID=A0A5N7DJ12_9EURO|nr:pyridoxal phosphate-dependent transferase [Aspergillus pseudonomiae]KAB8255646.1 pyridoxal phosphate-dependent transferase [Aspergillus pseudonomiae]KAE8406432.1 pyridoxal phosphate-dependent transferase [Aspergillus pseudonomiae]